MSADESLTQIDSLAEEAGRVVLRTVRTPERRAKQRADWARMLAALQSAWDAQPFEYVRRCKACKNTSCDGGCAS